MTSQQTDVMYLSQFVECPVCGNLAFYSHTETCDPLPNQNAFHLACPHCKSCFHNMTPVKSQLSDEEANNLFSVLDEMKGVA